jgi:hypothetical protein
MIVYLGIIVIVVIVVALVQKEFRKQLAQDAITLPVGTVKTYLYSAKSGMLTERLSKMPLDAHVDTMIRNGWEVVNQTSVPGNLRLGRTILFGESRSANQVTITYRRVRIAAVPVRASASQPVNSPVQVLSGQADTSEEREKNLLYLERLAVLKEKGLISDADFEQQKRKTLSSMFPKAEENSEPRKS